MKYNKETIYIKAKELRELTIEAVDSSPYEDAHLREKLLNLSLQIPLQIGLGLNLFSIEDKRQYLEKAEKKLIELHIAIDLSTSEFLRIDSAKFDTLIEEISEQIPITLEKAEVDEEERMEKILKEYSIHEENSGARTI